MSAVDYVQAQRQRRALIREVANVLERFDVLLTATGPSLPPEFEDISLASVLASRGINHAFAASANPVLAMCCGFTDDGLPLSMSIAGRPFGEATVLRVGHAYEQATPWRDCRPPIDRAPRERAAESPRRSLAAAGDKPGDETKGSREELTALAKWRGLRLSERQLEHFREAFPYVDRMVRRVPRDRPRWDELANVFEFPGEDENP